MGNDVESIYTGTLKSLLAPIWDFLEDDSISEIMINGPNEIYIERGGHLIKTDRKFHDERILASAVRHIGPYVGAPGVGGVQMRGTAEPWRALSVEADNGAELIITLL